MDKQALSPSLEQGLPEVEITFPWPDVWSVIDQVGFACQAFAQRYAHQREKKALGLPRRIGRAPNDMSGVFRPTGPLAQASNNSRHSSPVHIHIAGNPGAYLVRILALPAAYLPDLQTSRQFLGEFLQLVQADLLRRAQLPPPLLASRPARGPAPRSGPAASASSASPGCVKATFLGPHEKNPKFFWVQEQRKVRGLLKYGSPKDPLPALNAQIDVYRTNTNDRAPEYSWDDPQKRQQSQDRGPPKRGGRGRR